MAQKIYNFRTWVWHKVFRFPIRLKPAFDNKVRSPKLTVIFLHGISATSDTWLSTCRIFSKNPDLAGVRFVALDLLGFGKSLRADWLDYDYLDYELALDATLRHLHVKSPIVLVGHSMGSLIAADYVVNYSSFIIPEQLILVSPPVLRSDELAKLPDKLYAKSYGSLDQIAKDIPATEVIAKAIQRFSSFRSAYLKTAAFAKSMNNIILNPKNYHTFSQITLPTVLLHGHFDPLVMKRNLKSLAQANPRHLTYCSVMGHHDISASKRTKILNIILRTLAEEQT